MDTIKSLLPEAITGSTYSSTTSRSELETKLAGFEFERVLSHGTTSPYIYLLGKISSQTAIVHLQKLPFDLPGSSSNSETDDSANTSEEGGSGGSLVTSLGSVKSLEKNDIYEWALGWYGNDRKADVKVNIIHPCTEVHIRKYTAQQRYIINETPETYERVTKPYIESFPASRLQWLRNILNHEKEVEKIVYEDEDPETGFIILPDMKWDGKTLSALYLTAITHTPTLPTLRSLTPTHLPLLRKIKSAALKTVNEKYGLPRGQARLFLHYQPSYYHLHVHIVSMGGEGMGMEVGKAHLLDDVISLLELSEKSGNSKSLLQEMTFTYHLGEHDGLYKALIAAGIKPGEESPALASSSSSSSAPASSAAGEKSTGLLSEQARAAWEADADLPVCVACGTQYPGEREDCVICEDERQYVPASGQSWTTLRKLRDSGHKNEVVVDEQDERISYIKTVPHFAIGQTPFLISTADGTYMWDCSAYLSLELVAKLIGLQKPLKAIIISHPHFYSTSLTWAKVLGVPLIICAKDKKWYQRLEQVEGEVEWYEGKGIISETLTVLECGGHFPGSAILHWNRSKEPELESGKSRKDGIIFCADTAMVQPNQQGFTYQYSVPNMVPMNAHDVAEIWRKVKPFSFGQATSAWPGRFVREKAYERLAMSTRKHLELMGKPWLWHDANAERNQAVMQWNSAELLSGIKPTTTSHQSLIILNQPITRRDILERVWRGSDYRICADGGANRLYDLLGEGDREKFLPDMIKGDLDSLRDDVSQYYAGKGVDVSKDSSEYSTDLQKCLEVVDSKQYNDRESTIVIFGGLSGRLDQTTAVLSLAQKLRRRLPRANGQGDPAAAPFGDSDFKVYMGDELVSDKQGKDLYLDYNNDQGKRDIRIVSENCVAWVLDCGKHVIQLDHAVYGPTCGILPLGIESAHVVTKGLRWDFDWQTSFSTQISTSNHLDPANPQVEITADRPVWWTMEIKDLASPPTNASIPSSSRSLKRDVVLLSTARYRPGEEVPLLSYHLDRLQRAFAAFEATRNDEAHSVPDIREALERAIRDRVESLMKSVEEEYRLRIILDADGQVEVQAVPLPPGSAPFAYSIEHSGAQMNHVCLDPASSGSYAVPAELYRCKTTSRAHYQEALERAKQYCGTVGLATPFDTILHWSNPSSPNDPNENLISELSFSNIAFHVPDLADPSQPEWITPAEEDATPFLPGVMRRYLLGRGVLREGRVTVRQYRQWVKEGKQIVGMNGLRGLWRAIPLDV